ncbi:hypothetical protein L7F22_048994 [Adiantum nelumboides]|nr:hypothetical protein [Adiantum nelumboides]
MAIVVRASYVCSSGTVPLRLSRSPSSLLTAVRSLSTCRVRFSYSNRSSHMATLPSVSSRPLQRHTARFASSSPLGLTIPSESVLPQIEYSASKLDAAEWKGDILAVGVSSADLEKDDSGGFKNATLRKLDDALQGILGSVVAEEDFSGKAGQSTFVRLPGFGFKRIGLVGIDLSQPAVLSKWKSFGEAVAGVAKTAQAGSVAITLANLDEIEKESLQYKATAIATGVTLGVHEDSRFKSEKKNPTLKSLEFLGFGSGTVFEAQLQITQKVCQGVCLTKELVNAPPNVVTPDALADEALSLGATFEDVLTVQILDEEKCKELKMGAYLGVAAASTTNPPRFIHIQYNPPNEVKSKLAIVGKGLTFDSYGMPGANMNMAGFAQPDAQNQNMAGRPGMNFGSGMPLLNAPAYDNLTPKGKLKDYKEGGQAVKFDTFHGTHDKLKALLFLQQFDAAFAGGNFTEASKIRKAATFLKTNALQWWTTMLNQGVVPSTWVQFKQIFAPAWITNTFEVDVMTAWNQLSAINCESLEEYNAKFWDALLPVSSFKIVPLAEQIEKYCCGLPKGIKKYCTKTSVMNMAQLMENAEVADDLIQGKPNEDGFKTRRKEPQGKQFSAKGNVTSRLTVPPFKKKPFAGSANKPILFLLERRSSQITWSSCLCITSLSTMPQSIVSDRDPRMTSLFWKALFENMGTMLKFSSSFHPQTDGQSEEANSTVLDLLKCYVSEHKATWEHYLPLVEYAYNNTVHTSTGKAPFEIVEGGKKVPPILQTKDKIFEADKYVQNMDEAYRKIKLALEKTQSKKKKAADRHRRELVFSLGDRVLLRFEKARLRKMKGKERLFPKLGMRYYGPFQVCDKISDVAYRLKLPEDWKIHNAFHVSLLRPFVGDVLEDMVPEEQPEVEELDEILVAEQILAHKDRKVRGKVARRYLVKFKNYSTMDAKWMEEAELVDSPQLLQLGGYNLKTGAGSMIELMKFDMGGAGAALGAAKAIAAIRPHGVEVHFIVAACENMVSGTGMRPGDILTASNGKTIEVNNTDAEGRLTLADALVYSCKQGVHKIVDLATLTGACVVALGNDIAGLFTPNDDLAKELMDACEKSGEKLWRMPMEEGYWEMMKSGVADMVNTGGRAGGSITAALFLKQFVDENVQWAHLDIAGPVWNEKKKGATGFAVGTLVEWVLSHSSSAR